MKTCSISKLARACGLSRSTLLYHDRLGLLKPSGRDQDGMHRWHSEFERRAPEGHQESLLSLGIPLHEVEEIRRLSQGEWQMSTELR
jgi:DNA-binding transcriptional MerR regulator